jgi:hypothetical protein
VEPVLQRASSEGGRQDRADAWFGAMSGEQKERPAHWMVALVPLFGDVASTSDLPHGRGHRIIRGAGKPLRVRWDEAIPIDEDTAADERKRFYEALQQIRWLAPEIRRAIPKALRSSRSKQKFDDKAWRMMRLQSRIDQGATYKELAAKEGITVGTLKQQLKRFRREETAARRR